MKQNVTLLSTDRQVFGITVKQQTKNKFMCVSDLQSAYDKARWTFGWSDRSVSGIMRGKDFLERAYYLLKERNLVEMQICTFTELAEKEGIVKFLKGLDVWKTTGKGANRAVYCDPYIWVLLAMELNPMLYAKVVFWLTDSLIFDRIEAGTEYRPMNAAIKSIVNNPDYTKYAKMINKKVFGHHQSGMRNIASASELRKIADIEKFITQGIEMGMITKEGGVDKAISLYK